VGDHDEGLAVVGDRLAEQVEDLGAGARVEVAGGLVGEDDLRLARQRACDGDALLLSAVRDERTTASVPSYAFAVIWS